MPGSAKMRLGRGGLLMEATMINDYARQLMDAHGQRAIAEAGSTCGRV